MTRTRFDTLWEGEAPAEPAPAGHRLGGSLALPGARRGFSMVEMMLVIAIIGVLVALLLPAVQACREAARRQSCMNNARQLILAVHGYELAHGHFPAGVTNRAGPVRNLPEGNHLSWIARILPELGEPAIFRNMDWSVGAYHRRNHAMRQTIIPLLHCPSAPGVPAPVSHYAGMHHHREAPIDRDNTGVLYLNSKVSFEDIVDGSAHTIAVGEKYAWHQEDLGWISGTPATLRNAGGFIGQGVPPAGARGPWDDLPPWCGAVEGGKTDDPYVAKGGDPPSPLLVGAFGGHHPGGVVFAWCDGSVRLGSGTMSPRMFQLMANRKDRQVIQNTW